MRKNSFRDNLLKKYMITSTHSDARAPSYVGDAAREKLCRATMFTDDVVSLRVVPHPGRGLDKLTFNSGVDMSAH